MNLLYHCALYIQKMLKKVLWTMNQMEAFMKNSFKLVQNPQYV